MVSALTVVPCERKLLVRIVREMKTPRGMTTANESTPLRPYRAIKPGLMTKVAALVVEAAKDRPTVVGENRMLPTA